MDNVYKYMVNNNGYDYNIRKAAEEFQELALVLTQKSLKPYKVGDKEIIDEIGDCLIRMNVLLEIFNVHDVNKRIEEKLLKYNELISENKDIKI